MTRSRKAYEMKSSPRQYRWAVWLDGKRPLMASSRRQAKRIARKAGDRAHFSRYYASDGPLELAISDFVVWMWGSDGRWFRCLWLCPEGSVGAAAFGARLEGSSHQRRRYASALRNEGMWKLLGYGCISPSSIYPPSVVEVTFDSDGGMVCAGYRSVGEFRSLSQLQRALARERTQLTTYCGTVDSGVFKLWVEDEHS